jgi:hypothetical protein
LVSDWDLSNPGIPDGTLRRIIRSSSSRTFESGLISRRSSIAGVSKIEIERAASKAKKAKGDHLYGSSWHYHWEKGVEVENLKRTPEDDPEGDLHQYPGGEACGDGCPVGG